MPNVVLSVDSETLLPPTPVLDALADVLGVGGGEGVVGWVTVSTGSEVRPLGFTGVIWVDPLQLGTPNALSTDVVISPGEFPSVVEMVNAKGDLLVGTAADTLARLGIGTNNQVLTADSSQAGGMRWATPSSGGVDLFPKRKNKWYTTTHPIGGSGADVGAFGASGQRVFLLPFAVTSTILVDGLGQEIFAAGAAGKLMYYGIYSGDPNMATLNRVVATTAAADSTGAKKSMFADTTLAPGMYWLAVATNDTTNGISVRRASKMQFVPGSMGLDDPFYQATEWAIQIDGVNLTGGLPSSFNITSAGWADNDVPMVWAHRSAT